MNNKQSYTNNPRKFDTAFINPCIDRVIEAIELLNNGSRVLLVFENLLKRTDSFQLTETFPVHFYDFPQAIKKNKLWEKLFLLCPHLVQPQKVIYSHPGKFKTLIFKNKQRISTVSNLFSKNF